MTPLVIIGAGGFGRECHDIVVAMNRETPQWEFLGFIDDKEPDPELLARRGTRWIGTTKTLDQHAGTSFVVGIGDPATRERLAEDAERAGLHPSTLIHPSATIGLDVEVGAGTVICSHASVTTNVRMGRHIHLNLNCTVGHDCVLLDFSTVNPGATVSGSVLVASGAVIGTHAAVLQGISIGTRSFVGAGAVVTKDVAAQVTVVGVPATPLPEARV